jgi:large subunit ribosomal protein L9e
MRTLKASKSISVPEGVTVSITTRKVNVKGPRGTLSRDFGHQNVDIILDNGGRSIRVELWFGDRKALALIRTVLTHIKNMIVGVTKGYLFKMRMVYAHFPISVNIENNGKIVEVRNFLGEKRNRVVPMLGDVVCDRSKDGTKDEIILSGNDLEAVSQSAANIQQSTRVTDKDIRKFLDGVYVSYKGHIVQED